MANDHFSTVEALDDLHSKAVKKAAGIEKKKKPADDETPKETDHEAALDQVETEAFKLREKGRELMKKNLHNTPEYDALVVRSKELRRKKAFLEDSSKD